MTVERDHPGALLQDHADAAAYGRGARRAGVVLGGPPSARRAATPVMTSAVALLLLAGSVLFAVQALPSRQALTPPLDSDRPRSSQPVAPQLRPVVNAVDFDPFGDGQENPRTAPAAFDDDAASAWRTSTYYTELARQKAGVGLVLDLGAAVTVDRVTLELLGSPTDLEVRTSTNLQQPPQRLDAWVTRASAARAGSTAPLRFEEPVQTRYLLVWLTELPQVPEGWRGGVRGVEVRG